MPDSSDEREIVSRNLALNETVVSSAEAMNIETAHRVLQRALVTKEDSFTEASALDRVGEYSASELRLALKTVAEDLIRTHGLKIDSTDNMQLTKDIMDGRRLILTLRYNDIYEPSMTVPKLDLSLLQMSPYTPIIDNSCLLTDAPTSIPWNIGFGDRRKHMENHGASLQALKGEGTLSRFRSMYRGIRWTAANMLNWDQPGIIMPEQLDNEPLPSAETPRALPPTE